MGKKKRGDHAGTLEERPAGSGKWFVRVRLPDGSRPRYLLPEGLHARERVAMARQIAEREATRVAADLELLQPELATVRQFGTAWTSGELYKRHGEVRGLRPKRSAEDDAYRLGAHVYPLIGDKPVRDVTEQDIEQVLATAPVRVRERTGRDMSAATRRHVYQVMRRLFALAVKPGRLRSDSPVSDDVKPARGAGKLFGYLYPDELIAVLACRAVPLGRRVLYALAAYTGLRLGSLRTLKWGGIDFVHSTLTSLESKTDLPQLFELQPDLGAVLLGWYEHRGRPAAHDLVVAHLDAEDGREAQTLRRDLHAAGVEREQLFGGAENVQRIRFHDLRATFVTWALRQGRGKFWVQDRTGHLTEEQMTRYQRAARTLADLKILPFPDITSAIPELATLPDNVRRIGRNGERP